MNPIVCKPKKEAFFSIGLFLIASYTGLIFLLYGMTTGAPSWWQYILLVILSVTCFSITASFVGNFKVLTAQGDTLKVYWPMLFKSNTLSFKDLKQGKLEQVKTPNGLYEQLVLVFPDKLLKVGNQEYEHYEQLKRYVQKQQGRSRQGIQAALMLAVRSWRLAVGVWQLAI